MVLSLMVFLLGLNKINAPIVIASLLHLEQLIVADALTTFGRQS
jgi:hypothetical protein